MTSGPAIYDPDGRQRTTRDPTLAEDRALADLRKALRRAVEDIARERRIEEQKQELKRLQLAPWRRGA